MHPPKKVVYRGRTFYLQSCGHHYQDGNRRAEERLLHRVKWIERNGPIPKGMCVHHINGDWTDDSPSNHALMSQSDHSRLTMTGLWNNPIHATKLEAGRQKGVQEAKGWHKSDAGREWHRRHGKSVWAKVSKRKVLKRCYCGQRFKCFEHHPRKYCSDRCSERRRIKRMETRECVICDKPFAAFVHTSTKTCSRRCSAFLKWRTVEEMQVLE